MTNKEKPMISNDPLHGVTLAVLLTTLVERFGWARLAEEVNINCFKSNPSIKSSLTFLRRTPWARTQVENLYLDWVVASPWSGDDKQHKQQ